MHQVCDHCFGQPGGCIDCLHTGRAEVRVAVERRHLSEFRRMLVDLRVITARDLDSRGMWAH